MSSFKVGDIVYLVQRKESLSVYVDWAQKMILDKTRCKVIQVNSSTLNIVVLEGEQKGRGLQSNKKAFKKIGLDDLEVEEL